MPPKTASARCVHTTYGIYWSKAAPPCTSPASQLDRTRHRAAPDIEFAPSPSTRPHRSGAGRARSNYEPQQNTTLHDKNSRTVICMASRCERPRREHRSAFAVDLYTATASR